VRKYPFAAFAACLVLAACGRFGPLAELSVVIPEPPEAWARAFPDLTFVLTFPDCSGKGQSLTVGDPSQPVGIACPKLGNTPILAYPDADLAAGLLRPAGGLYPVDLQDLGGVPRLELSWRGGCLALIFARLSQRGLDTSRINSRRLAQYIDRHPDPWVLDLDGVVEKLILDDFSAYDIEPLSARDVSMCPGAGEWFLESPLIPPSKLADGEVLALKGLSIGAHAVFSVQGRRIRVWVGERETAIGPLE
jgi:hypothetical protein